MKASPVSSVCSLKSRLHIKYALQLLLYLDGHTTVLSTKPLNSVAVIISQLYSAIW